MDKYEPLRQASIEHLKGWDAQYGIELSDAKFDAVVVRFDRLPDDVMPLARDIYEFCPDTVDQHFGCVAEMLSLAEETGEDVPPEMAELMEGVDLEDEDHGLELLRRSLVKHKTVALWWD